MNIHFPGREGLDKPVVGLPEARGLLSLRLDSLFTVSEVEIDLLKQGAAAA